MFILLNGSFGIGKSTIADLLVRDIEGAALFDPESIGYVLRRLPAWAVGRKNQPADYQDLNLWRHLIVTGARLKHKFASVVVVPMAFSNLDYLETFAGALDLRGQVHLVCLVAPLETVRDRLHQRAIRAGVTVTPFEHQRSGECVAAHENPAFGAPVDARRPPAEIVADIRELAGL